MIIRIAGMANYLMLNASENQRLEVYLASDLWLLLKSTVNDVWT